MAFKIKIALTADLVDWMCVWVGTVFFLIISEKLFSCWAFPRLIGLYKPEPQGRIAAATFFLAVRYLQRFHCNISDIFAAMPPKLLRYFQRFHCNASKIFAAMPPKLLWYLQHFHCNVSDIFYRFVTLVWSLKIWVGLSYPFWACEIFTIKEVPQHFSIVAWSLNSSVWYGVVFQVFVCTRNYAFGSQQHLQLWWAERFGKIRMDDDQSSASQLRRSRLVFYQSVSPMWTRVVL